jgi:hypothetical protein
MKNGELCVPLAAVTEAGEDGAGVAPGVGDTVELTVTGRVTRAENGELYVQPETANGQPLADAAGGGDEMDLEAEGEALRGMAAGSAGLMLALLTLFLWVAGAGAQGYREQLRYSKTYANSLVATNSYPASIVPTVVHKIIVENSSATALWVWVGDTNVTTPANNNFPVLPPKLAAATGGNVEYDFGPGGIPMRLGCVVATSTTDRTLTNSTASFVITVVHSPIQ